MIDLAALAAGFTALAASLLVRSIWRPHRRLGPRVRPYTIGSRISLGGSADVRAVADGGGGGAVVLRLVNPIMKRVAEGLGRMLDRGGDAGLILRIRQAGLYPDLADGDRLATFRLRQLQSLAVWVAGSFAAAFMIPFSTPRALAVVVLGAVIGATRQRGRLERAVEDRRARMRIEIYTVDQLLAMRARSGGGVLQAVSQLVERGTGEVITDLAEALRNHRAGARASDAFGRIAAATPEPHCARTYALLGVAEDRGVDLAEGLLALAEDVREARREAIKRNATKRRAAMLVPTIAILAPVMLLFVGAPLPRIVLGWQ